MTTKTTDVLTSLGRFVKKQVQESRGPRFVEIGILSDEPKKPFEKVKVSLIDVAIINEFGGGHVPERSYIRSTFDQNRNAWLSLTATLKDKVMSGQMEIDSALSVIGRKIQDDIRQKIVSLRTPPNSPRTIKNKRSSNPLIDTGQLRQSINYRVVP